MKNEGTQDLLSLRVPIIFAQYINANRKHFLPATSKVSECCDVWCFVKVTAGLRSVLMKCLVTDCCTVPGLYVMNPLPLCLSFLFFFWQSPYNPAQNAGSASLVYSPQTQPMNAQPQSRPVSVPSGLRFTARLPLSTQTVCGLLWLFHWVSDGGIWCLEATQSPRNIDWSRSAHGGEVL